MESQLNEIISYPEFMNILNSGNKSSLKGKMVRLTTDREIYDFNTLQHGPNHPFSRPPIERALEVVRELRQEIKKLQQENILLKQELAQIEKPIN